MKTLLCVLTLAVLARAEPPHESSRVVAWVNGNAIHERDLLDTMQPVVERLQKAHGRPLDAAMRQKVRDTALDRLIERLAVVTSAEAKAVQLSETEVEQHLEQIITDKAFGSQNRYKSYLEARGMSWKEWRAGLKETMVIDQLKEDLAKKCPPCTPEEARALYTQHRHRFHSGGRVKVSVIVLDPETTAGHSAGRFATGIQNRIFDAGNDAWEACALDFSTGPYADGGGHWDWRLPAELPVGLGKNIHHMQPGEIEKISHGDFYYFLRLDQVEDKEQLSFDNAKPQVEDAVMQRKAASAWSAWTEQQKNKASVRMETSQETTTILAIGDSITARQDSFRSVLVPALKDSGVQHEFIGPNKDTISCHAGYGGKNTKYLRSISEEIYSKYPADIVMIHSGHNSFSKDSPVQGIIHDTQAIIETVRRINPDVTVLLAQVIPAGKLPKYAYIPELNKALETLSKRLMSHESKVILVDQSKGFDWKTDTLKDKVHPSASGARKMAAKWMDNLLPLLDKKDAHSLLETTDGEHQKKD